MLFIAVVAHLLTEIEMHPLTGSLCFTVITMGVTWFWPVLLMGLPCPTDLVIGGVLTFFITLPYLFALQGLKGNAVYWIILLGYPFMVGFTGGLVLEGMEAGY